MKEINELLSIMKHLRDPDAGCPWDKKQTFSSIGAYTLEEVYEVLESIESNDMEGLCDELGDLLFHIAFYAEMAEEQGHFDFRQIVEKVSSKLKRRHPHVFADKILENDKDLSLSWESIKQTEREDKARKNNHKSRFLDNISTNMPAIMRAEKLQKRAATIDFDWLELKPVIEKIEEELDELKAEINEQCREKEIIEEMGDLLFSCVNLSRHIKVNPEFALRQANYKFESRFRIIEEKLEAENLTLTEASTEQMEALWEVAKAMENQS